jgi:hypothetical protein
MFVSLTQLREEEDPKQKTDIPIFSSLTQLREDEKKSVLNFTVQLTALLPKDQPIRFVGPLLALISTYATPTCSRLMKMGAKPPNTTLCPARASDKEFCLRIEGSNSAISSVDSRIEYERAKREFDAWALDLTRAVYYYYDEKLRKVFTMDRVSGAVKQFSSFMFKKEDGIAWMVQEERKGTSTVYILHITAHDLRIARLTAESRNSFLLPPLAPEFELMPLQYRKHVEYGKLVTSATSLYAQTSKGPLEIRLHHEVAEVIPLINMQGGGFDLNVMILLNGLLFATWAGGAGHPSWWIAIDPSRFDATQRIVQLKSGNDTPHHCSVSPTDSNLLYFDSWKGLFALRLSSDLWMQTHCPCN